ncbi:hypothetical protein GUA87_06675 [Sneathiella sp. P13V-1]|uniref:beta-ketoacyl synthase chain length factor n=1 Tax=Sneathiella sp. P13V-1 TaxID=2697366 RepID=UPI00187B813D|nr:beta-ketoacyl synthase chain length factor [Sneathiella sp. P13V-1]MBE7636524.1 hypothetical protein [Sneathiella sp. P13V-1]
MRVCVSDWGMIAPANEQSLETLDTKALPASARRRLGVFGQLAGCLMKDKTANSPLIVFASRYGDEKRSLQILEEICKGEALSPMNFSLSVHNAVPGVLSIAWKLKEMQSVIAAGADTFAMGLTEAFSLLDTFPDKPVLLVYVDIPLPEVFAEFEDKEKNTGVCAILLQKKPQAEGHLEVKASLEPKANSTACNLQRQFEHLKAFLEGSAEKAVIEAQHFNWNLERAHG